MSPGPARSITLRCSIAALLALPALIAAPGRSLAQRPVAPRFGGISAIVAIPRDNWGDLTGIGIGGELVSSAPLTGGGPLRLRSDLALLYHLNKDVAVPADHMQPGDQITLGTTASMFHVALGPEFSSPTGRTRTYLFGTVGYSSMWARTSAGGRTSGGAVPYDFQISKHTSSFAWSAGGGVRIMRNRGRVLDIGAEYRRSIGVNVLLPTDVYDDGVNVTYGESKIDANQLIVRLGFSRIGR